MRRWFIWVLRQLFRQLFRVELRGDWHVLQQPKVLVVANHESFIDGVLLALFMPARPVFVVHTGIAEHWLFKRLLVLVDYLAVAPTSPMAIKQVVRLVESGRPVVIFPEGRITVTGSLMKIYNGPAFVAAKTGATLLPVHLDGPGRTVFSRLQGHPQRSWFPKMRITVMPGERIEMPTEATSQARREQAGETLRRIMQNMQFASRPRGTLYQALEGAAQRCGRRYRLLEDMRQVELSYGDILKMTLALGRICSKITVPSERFGVLLPNLAATVGVMIGAGAFGRVPAMLNYTAGRQGIESACAVADIKVILTSRAFIETARLGEVIAALDGRFQIHYLEDLRAQLTGKDKLWLLSALMMPSWLRQRGWLPAANPNAPAVTLFTSGSEGVPKGVVLTHRQLLANLTQVQAVIDFSATDKFMNALPVFHAFGLTAGTLLPLITGTKLFLYPSPLHYKVIPEVVYDRNCSVLFGTSTFLGQYAKHAHPYDFFRVRYVVAGAEKLASTVRDLWFEKFGIRILEGYGATETAPVLAVNTPMAYRSGSVGQFLPGIEWQLESVPGIERGGILHVRGPNVMAGYLRITAPGVLEPTASELGAGWYNTGDIVEVDHDGFVHIQGRLKRFAKIAGEMVSLEVVEKLAALACPAGQHAASSRPDESKGEALVLFSTVSVTAEQLNRCAKEQGFPSLAVPRDLRVMAALPLLGTGKTDYLTLKTLAATSGE
ncbi:bifunctional acyl-ACP--phospholipid O-acyltransferase/long-chain-fatty-acid--ACP ligase [Aeromonas cavernicola]|uniref:Bifunctional acyl-ACP--phospholipid O-acyltransferase/long-chain-fatty-acid--ACP ligase n=1 Tax=Aeromonas cavernicola TaxID=1006623 RepID=A0A2H9U2V3_9GAMM|nr:bifunctional acyl-ACP--phospholipid O-acyltransferase/long-chain-fatty-acid--ACP ligase [Aeromonas cavernicola]PJG58351.1 bifunctional acyl-ACP--phospholipid O-acyltransferase/long-chain-fatty-acid--ACP ligase [Aeromonas cavernicola]